jgi:hypothetical protein
MRLQASRFFADDEGWIMHVLKIVRALEGWAVQTACAVTAPCRSHAEAVAQATRVAQAIRRHGETVTVIVEPPANDEEPVYFVPSPRAAAAARIRAPRRVRRVG